MSITEFRNLNLRGDLSENIMDFGEWKELNKERMEHHGICETKK